MRAFALILARKRAIADDIVACTVVAAWANIAAFEPGSNMRAWLFRMVRNAYYTERDPRERATSDDSGAFYGRLKLRSGADGSVADNRFRRAFNALADEQREALVLLEGEGFSIREAAAVCGCTPATITSRGKLGRRKAGRARLAGDGRRQIGGRSRDARGDLSPCAGRTARRAEPETYGACKPDAVRRQLAQDAPTARPRHARPRHSRLGLHRATFRPFRKRLHATETGALPPDCLGRSRRRAPMPRQNSSSMPRPRHERRRRAACAWQGSTGRSSGQKPMRHRSGRSRRS